MASTEKLIELVRERRLLYDLSDVDYKNRHQIKAAWLEIATEMGTEDDKYWVSKWKVLKDNYAKHKKANAVSSGQAYKKYRNWPWAELMRFLDDFNKNRPTETNIDHDAQSQPGSTQENLNSSTQDNINSSTQENLNSSTQVNLNSSTQVNSNLSHIESQVSVSENRKSEIRKRKASNNVDPTNKILEYLRMKNEQKYKFDEVDYFFLSYAHTFKKLPNRMQSMIKLEIATLFARYELQNEEGASAGTSTFHPSMESPSAFQNPIPSPSSVSSTESMRPHSADSNSSAVPQVTILPNTTFLRETSTPEITNLAQEDLDTQNLAKYYETITYTLTNNDSMYQITVLLNKNYLP